MKVIDIVKQKRIGFFSMVIITLLLLVGIITVMEKGSDAATSQNLSGPIVDANSGLIMYNYVYLGYYPQTEVVSAELTDEIINAEYGSDDVTKVGSMSYKRELTSSGNYSYFMIEPVKWRILENDGTYIKLQSAQILDCMEYNATNDAEYKNCSLRTWLNGMFLETAFVDDASNGLKSTYDEDWITLPDAENILDENSGALPVTDYALSHGCYSTDFSGASAGIYWLCSSGADAKYVDCIGEVNSKAASDKDCGVTPVIRVAVNDYYYSSQSPLLKEPVIHSDGTTAWNAVYFGTYPQTEITTPTDAIIYGNYKDDVAVVDGVRYKRILENNVYRYFRFDAIRWRVLKRLNGKYFLQCDSILDMYTHDMNQDAGLSEWLNTDFYETAFMGIARNNLVAGFKGNYVDVVSDDLLQSLLYGYQNDFCRQIVPSSYATAISLLGKEESAVYWFRSEENEIDGYVNNQGEMVYYVSAGVKGICPVITLKEIPYVWGVSKDSVVNLPLETSNPSESPSASAIASETSAPIRSSLPSTGTGTTLSPAGTELPFQTTNLPIETETPGSGILSTEAPDTNFTTERPVVKVMSKSAKSHKLSWKRVEGTTGYCIYMSTSKTGTYDLYSTVTGNSGIVKKLKKGKKYYYVVIAYKKEIDGRLNYSNPSKVVSKLAGNPQQPQLTAGISKSNGKKYVSIHWQNVSDADYICLYRSRGGKKYERILNNKIKKYKKGVTITYFYAKGNYYFKIRSYNKYQGKRLYSQYSKAKKVSL